MKYYEDLREYLEVLEAKEKLIRFTKEINKDTELIPLVRWQFRGLPEEERKAWLFSNVVDSKGKKYDIPVAVGTHAASLEIYGLAMGCSPEEIYQRWTCALSQPVEPVMVESGPVQEVVLQGDEIQHLGAGFDRFPIPISTPGFDPAPFLTSSCWVTKDPETGIRNVGVYRAHLKGPARTGVAFSRDKHIAFHWQKARAMGKELPAALVLGAVPSLGLVATSAVPYGLDEYAVAGAIAGQPLKLVKCQTVDLEVPATSEIVAEGIISTEYVEPEAPFGEYTGYMGARHLSAIFEAKCITHRRDPIYHAFISQFPPSESSKIRGIGIEGSLYKFLKVDCNIPGIRLVAFHEPSGSWSWLVISIKKTNPTEPWQALNCAAGYSPYHGKVIIVVDDDIDPRDSDSVIWALSFRMQPQRDVRISGGKALALDPSAILPELEAQTHLPFKETSVMLIDATRKWAYPPIALPVQEFMERARQIWEQAGLPRLKPRVPWYGYSLGWWLPENEEEAEIALRGDYYLTGQKLAGQRKETK